MVGVAWLANGSGGPSGSGEHVHMHDYIIYIILQYYT